MSCAVRVKSGQLRQLKALGISAEMKSKGYALLCVGFQSSDLEVETEDEDEVYWIQFGRYFARVPVLSTLMHQRKRVAFVGNREKEEQRLKPNSFAFSCCRKGTLELAMADE